MQRSLLTDNHDLSNCTLIFAYFTDFVKVNFITYAAYAFLASKTPPVPAQSYLPIHLIISVQF